MVVNRTLSRKEFIERMQGYHRGISASTTEAVLMDVEEILVEMLSMGYNVNLEGLGTFSLSLGFEDDKPTEMQGDDDKMTYRKVGVRDVNFKASPDFIKSVKQAADRDLERDMGGVKLILKRNIPERSASPEPWMSSMRMASSVLPTMPTSTT